MIDIQIGNKTYRVEEAKSKEELYNGLKGKKELPEDAGMLFYLKDEEPLVMFTMEDVEIPLDIIFINQDQEVVDVCRRCKPGLKYVINNTENLDEDDYIAYVLEVNPKSGIKIGDGLDLGDESPVMKVLAKDGSTQMELWGGERIISRRETKIIIKKSRKAEESQKDSDFKSLGRYIFKVFKGLDTRDAEYVQSPS